MPVGSLRLFFDGLIIIITFFILHKTSFASTEVYFQKEASEVTKGDIFSVNLKILKLLLFSLYLFEIPLFPCKFL